MMAQGLTVFFLFLSHFPPLLLKVVASVNLNLLFKQAAVITCALNAKLEIRMAFWVYSQFQLGFLSSWLWILSFDMLNMVA